MAHMVFFKPRIWTLEETADGPRVGYTVALPLADSNISGGLALRVDGRRDFRRQVAMTDGAHN